MSSNPPNYLTPEERARLRELASKATPGGFTDEMVLRLLDELDRRPPPLVWSKEPPTSAGRYYHRRRKGSVARIIVVRENSQGALFIVGSDYDYRIGHDLHEGEFAGPIPQPREASE